VLNFLSLDKLLLDTFALMTLSVSQNTFKESMVSDKWLKSNLVRVTPTHKNLLQKWVTHTIANVILKVYIIKRLLVPWWNFVGFKLGDQLLH